MSRRIRKHANPFNVRTRLGTLDRLAIFGREAPMEVDLGCGAAAFIIERARNHPDRDFVGLEVRKPLVDAIEGKIASEGPRNAAIFYANAHENLRLAEPGVVRCFHVHFPDPCFKKRHQKRRILQPKIVRIMAEQLPTGGLIYAQSDVLPLAEEMFDFLRAEDALESRLEHLQVARPFPERTEWERHHESEAEPIYRMLFEKVKEPCGQVPAQDFRDTNPERVGR